VIEIGAETLAAGRTARAINDYFASEGWTDGYPIIPPTVDVVGELLGSVGRPANELIARLPPYGGEATVELIAINAAMAGCRPRELPVVIAAVEAVADPGFNLFGIETSSNPAAILMVVSGPLAEELGVNSKEDCLGGRTRVNASIGRAIRLCVINIGGSRSDTVPGATHGQPGKHGMCVAENLLASPWPAYSVDRGFSSSETTVTVFSVTGTANVHEGAARTARGVLKTLADSCSYVGAQNVQIGGGPLWLLCPEHAQIFAADGYSKSDLKRALYETARVSVDRFPRETLDGFVWHRRPKWFQSDLPFFGVPIADSWEQIEIVVAGGVGPHSVYLPSWGASRAITRRVAS
jgi:hypothetical protein